MFHTIKKVKIFQDDLLINVTFHNSCITIQISFVQRMVYANFTKKGSLAFLRQPWGTDSTISLQLSHDRKLVLSHGRRTQILLDHASFIENIKKITKEEVQELIEGIIY